MEVVNNNPNSKTITKNLISGLLIKELERRPVIDIRDLYTCLNWSNQPNKRKDQMVTYILDNAPPIIHQLHTESSLLGKIMFAGNYDKIKKDPIIRAILEDLAKPEKFRQNPAFNEPTPYLQNVIENSLRCLCNQIVDNYTPSITCAAPKCGRVMHRTCMKLTPTEESPLFECPHCVLWKCDPLHEVIKALIPPFLIDNTRKEFSIDEEMFKMVKGKTNYCVEVRSIRLEDKNHEQCWPNSGELILNQQKQAEFRPLQQNSSLKKRKDEKFFTKEVHLGNNYLYLKMMKKDTYLSKKVEETYVAAVFLVKKLTCDELVQTIKQNSQRSIEDCQRMISLDFQSSPLDIDMVRHPLTCVFDMQLLKTPAKGAHCKHINCFSLENFISVWQKNGQRKWTCPVCKLKSYDIIVDTYFEKIMNELRAGAYEDPTSINVEIYRDATYRFIKDDSEDEMENDDQVVSNRPDKAVEKISNIVILDESDEEPPRPTPVVVQTKPIINIELEVPLQQPVSTAMQIEIGTTPAKSRYENQTPPSSSMKSLIEIVSPQQIDNNLSSPVSQPIEHHFQPQVPTNIHIPPLLQPVSTQKNFNWPTAYYQQTPPSKSSSKPSNSPHVFQPFLNQKASEVYPESAPSFSFSSQKPQFQQSQPQQFIPIQPFPTHNYDLAPTAVPAFLQQQAALSHEMKKYIDQVQPKSQSSQSKSQKEKGILTQIGHTRPVTSTVNHSPENKSLESVEYIKRPADPQVKAQAENNIQKLLEFSNKKLELPTFKDFKNKKFSDIHNVNQDRSLQRSKKIAFCYEQTGPHFSHKNIQSH